MSLSKLQFAIWGAGNQEDIILVNDSLRVSTSVCLKFSIYFTLRTFFFSSYFAQSICKNICISSSIIRAVQRPYEPNPPSTKLTSSVVNDRFLPPKPEFGGSDVGFPSPKSNQLDPIDPKNFLQYLVDRARSRPFLSRSWWDFAGSNWDLAENGLD